MKKIKRAALATSSVVLGAGSYLFVKLGIEYKAPVPLVSGTVLGFSSFQLGKLTFGNGEVEDESKQG